jgi:hypothetical protein
MRKSICSELGIILFYQIFMINHQFNQNQNQKNQSINQSKIKCT